MRIFVTNDDGIESVGLHVLAQRLTQLGDVTVFAPSGEFSGAGAAIGHIAPGVPDVFTVERPELPDVAAAHHLNGPPALAMLLACKGLFGDPPDLVVSGINPGWNVGNAVHFSGTVGACLTAGLFDIPAIAVSQHSGADQQWPAAAEAAAQLVPEVMARPTVLNVNLANLSFEELKGVKRTSLSDRIPFGMYEPTLAPGNGDGGRAVSFQRNGQFSEDEGDDTRAVNDGYISVTELTATHTT